MRNLTRLRRGGGLGRGVDLVIGGGPVASDRDRRRVVGGVEGWAICGGEAGWDWFEKLVNIFDVG